MGWPTKIAGKAVVIGDLHGQADRLDDLLAKLEELPDFAERWVVFIGDLVDRGPDSRRVLDMILDLRDEHGRVTGVMGNHDLALAAALGLVDTPPENKWAARWLDHYDSESTFASYGVEFGDLAGLAAALPPEHATLLAELPWCVEHAKYLFVHAGLLPTVPYATQVNILRGRDFSLIRPDWLCSKSLARAAPPPDCPVTVVSGHVQTPTVEFHSKRVLCDTTGGVGGDLSAVLLPEHVVATSGDNPPKTPWWRFWQYA